MERVRAPAGCPQKSLESCVVGPGLGEGPGPSAGLLAFLGDGGYIPLVSLHTRQWVGSLKMNGSVRAAAFSTDGNDLVTAGVVQDLRSRSENQGLRSRAQGPWFRASLCYSPTFSLKHPYTTLH